MNSKNNQIVYTQNLIYDHCELEIFFVKHRACKINVKHMGNKHALLVVCRGCGGIKDEHN